MLHVMYGSFEISQLKGLIGTSDQNVSNPHQDWTTQSIDEWPEIIIKLSIDQIQLNR